MTVYFLHKCLAVVWKTIHLKDCAQNDTSSLVGNRISGCFLTHRQPHIFVVALSFPQS